MSSSKRSDRKKTNESSEPPFTKTEAALVDAHRKRILLMGHTGSGKTACKDAVFHGLGAKDAYRIWDTPSNYSAANFEVPLSAFSSIIYVIDLQDELQAPIHYLTVLLAAVFDQTKERSVHIDIFVHKVESISEDYKMEMFRQLQQRIEESCEEHAFPLQDMELTFHLTSVYDHTVFEAWSRVIQKLIEPLAFLENLMNVLCGNSGLTKAYLFDSNTLIHVATDSSPPDPIIYGLCCEYIQTITEFSKLYRAVEYEPEHNVAPHRPEIDALYGDLTSSTSADGKRPTLTLVAPVGSSTSLSTHGSKVNPPSTSSSPQASRRAADSVTPSPVSPTSSPTAPHRPKPKKRSSAASAASKSGAEGGRIPKEALRMSSRASTSRTATATSSSSHQRLDTEPDDGTTDERQRRRSLKARGGDSTPPNVEAVEAAAKIFDVNAMIQTERRQDGGTGTGTGVLKQTTWASSAAKLKPQTTLAYWEITSDLCLAALLRAETYDVNQSLIDYNVTFFRKGVQRIVDMEETKWRNAERDFKTKLAQSRAATIKKAAAAAEAETR